MDPIMTFGTLALDALHLVFLVLAVGLGFAWWQLRQTSQAARQLLERDLEAVQADAERNGQRARTLEAVAREAELKLAAAQARSAEDEQKFAQLAQGVLAQANTLFLERADETFKRHREGAQGELKELMKPIGENFETFRQRVDAIEKVRTEDKSAIQEQVLAIKESLLRTTAETGKLVTALTTPRGAGRWGETTLRNVLERAGLTLGNDFEEQVTIKTDDGTTLRPDVVIKLPGDRKILVDSKVSIDDFLKALDETDPEKKLAHLKLHARKVRDHIKSLGKKDYPALPERQIDFVALFIPGESFYVAAIEHQPDLFEFASDLNVIVVTPSTMLALAKSVAYGWRQEKVAKEVTELAKQAADLYRRFGALLKHVEGVGKSLGSSVDSFNELIGSMDKNVVPMLKKFEQHGVVSKDKSVPELKQIETSIRETRHKQLSFDTE